MAIRSVRGPLPTRPCARVPVGLLSGLVALAACGGPGERDGLDRDYTQELPRIPPLEPADALASFEVHPEFRIELAAAEPLVRDPIAMAFDASGDLYVVEMRGYSEERDENVGAVRLLRDADGDGRFDQSHVFLEGLAWPTAVACWKGGVFVGVPPDILYAKDTDGDHRADIVETVYSGFSLTNVQGLLNSFEWGLDNRIHGATSVSGASVVAVGRPGQPPLELRGRDFSFDPLGGDIRPESGGGQHGLSFDRWGRKFVCHNSRQVIYVAYEDRYVKRNPHLAPPPAGVDAAADGPTGDVFRISPIEPWRIVRTRLRVKGLVPGPIEGGGTPAGYFTSATGITLYGGDAWPDAYRNDLLVADVGSNLIHRKTLTWPGIVPVTERARAGTEFVRSRDLWFRPVQMANGPDGALYVADMYREVIEHPDSLPPVIKRHLDLTRGRDRGRLYRIVPRDFDRPPLPDLTRAETSRLSELLSHPDAWHRGTASRLLYERQAGAEVPLEVGSPLGRVHGLYARAGSGALTAEALARGLDDPHPRVREHALRLAEPLLATHPFLAERAAALAGDPDPHVRYRLAFSLGEAPAGVATPALAALAAGGSDPWLRLAVLSSAAPVAADLLHALLERGAARDWLVPLARQVAAAGRLSEVEGVLKALEALPEGAAEAGVRGLVEGAEAGRRSGELRALLAGSARATRVLEDLLARARTVAADAGVEPGARAEALATLGLDTWERAAPLLAAALAPEQPAAVQRAAARALDRFEDPAVARLLLERWPALGPEALPHVVEVLLATAERTDQLLAALEDGSLSPEDLDSVRVRELLEHPRSDLRERARRALAEHVLRPRPEVVEAFRGALEARGDPERGRSLFERNCAVCHRAEGRGDAVGPDLETTARAGRETILVNLLDPNREVNPRYISYVVEAAGRRYTGIISSETATSLTLRRAGGGEDTILRRDVESVVGSGISLMPEGWEQAFDEQGLADLIAFVVSLAGAGEEER